MRKPVALLAGAVVILALFLCVSYFRIAALNEQIAALGDRMYEAEWQIDESKLRLKWVEDHLARAQ